MMTEQKLFMIEATNRCKVCESPFVADLVAEVRRLQAERDAYKKAKAENDDRFMGERDAALAERDRAERNEREYRAACEMSIGALRDSRERWEQRTVLAEAERDAARAASQNAHECLFETEQSLSEARRVLRLVEWRGHTETRRCPSCGGGYFGTDHTPDCALAAVLAQEEK